MFTLKHFSFKLVVYFLRAEVTTGYNSIPSCYVTELLREVSNTMGEPLLILLLFH